MRDVAVAGFHLLVFLGPLEQLAAAADGERRQLAARGFEFVLELRIEAEDFCSLAGAPEQQVEDGAVHRSADAERAGLAVWKAANIFR